MRNERPTQPPLTQSRPTGDEQQTPSNESTDGEDPETRIQFLSWDAPLVPDR